ncbi:MAG: GAF domain-containing protein [Proteobacteria bacterium]|nr:GAF domain-containing protein [Pseudomonadota bacterium]
MYWQVDIPNEGSNPLSVSVTVEADNWFTALRNGLDKNGIDGKLVSNLSCNINSDQSVTVTDFITHRVYTLRPMERTGESGAKDVIGAMQKSESLPNLEFLPKVESSPKTKFKSMPELESPVVLSGDLLPHKIFYWRDESPKDGSGIYYRERLLSVDPNCPRNEVSRLIEAYFVHLKDMGSRNGTKLFISVQVYDHQFKDHSLRPAVAALTWKEWSPKKPKIFFPLYGEQGVAFSKRPSRSSDDDKRLATIPKATRKTPDDEPKKAKPAGGTLRKKRGVRRRAKDNSVDEKMIEAFERMQEIYKVRDHDGAAAFVLSLSRELIDCNAGSCMLLSPGNYELYVSAAEGPVADAINNNKVSLTKGIVGFATRSSTVVNVSNPKKDPLFDNELDIKSGFKTLNVLCAPLQYEGRTFGAIELLNSPRKEGFVQSEANILSYLGGALAEYITVSLPSREADFSDKEFLESGKNPQTPTKKKTTTNKKATINPVTLKSSSKTAAKSTGSGAQNTPKKRSQAKADESLQKKSTKGKKGKKKRKRRK